MKMIYENDRSVECDCGHTVEPGHSYWKIKLPIWTNSSSKGEWVVATACDNDECVGSAMFNKLDFYANYEEVRLYTAKEKGEYDDE